MESFQQYGIIPVDYYTLLASFKEFKSPKDKISSLEKYGKLIRLKKGLYIVSPEDSGEISVELVANHLYGPSYVSYETALAYYGLIPERVYAIKSATSKRRKSYSTPVGRFEYITVPEVYFSIGMHQQIIKDDYAFIMAKPEKAICDLILSTSALRLQSKKAMREYLIEDLRIDMESWGDPDAGIIKECIEFGYKKNELRLLHEIVAVS
jgi:hypothetical protein